MEPRVCVAPPSLPIQEAVVGAGGVLVEANIAEAIVWTDPRDPDGLKELLAVSPARWVQLPFAGIESFFEAETIDPARTWTCAKGIYGHATAEHALALMLMAARTLHRHARDRRWSRQADTRRLAESTVLILGTGGIGRALAEMLEPLRARILAVSRTGAKLPGAERTQSVEHLEDLVGEADFVVVAAALTPGTRGLIGRDTLARMKPDAWLINVARGRLVDTDALVDSLRAGRIGGAALDVTDPEPLPDDHPLWALDDVIVTPHVANTVRMAMPELKGMVARNVTAFARDEPLEGLVDPALGY
jgi:D-3-phosphoglycerate dehydrogenase